METARYKIKCYIKLQVLCFLFNKSGFKRVARITREEQKKKREEIAAESHPLLYQQENISLASEDEIAIANINLRKAAEDEKRKARKELTITAKVVDEGADTCSAEDKPRSNKRTKSTKKK